MEYWVEPLDNKKGKGMVFNRPTLKEALVWINQNYVKGNYKVVIREGSKRTKCCNRLIGKGKAIEEIFTNTRSVAR